MTLPDPNLILLVLGCTLIAIGLVGAFCAFWRELKADPVPPCNVDAAHFMEGWKQASPWND